VLTRQRRRTLVCAVVVAFVIAACGPTGRQPGVTASTPSSVVSVVRLLAGGGSSPTPPSGNGGPATQATLGFPTAIAVDPSGNVFIADNSPPSASASPPPSCQVRKVSVAAGIITAVTGSGVPGRNLDSDGRPITFCVGIALNSRGEVFVSVTGWSAALSRQLGSSRLLLVPASLGLWGTAVRRPPPP
jgi:hypothetical protein